MPREPHDPATWTAEQYERAGIVADRFYRQSDPNDIDLDAMDARNSMDCLPQPPAPESVMNPAGPTTTPDLNNCSGGTGHIIQSDLNAALLAAQRAMPAIGRDGHNAHAGYDYTSADAWIAAARTVLHDHGLMMRRDGYSLNPWGDRLLIEATFTLTHVQSGQSLRLKHALPAEARKGTPIDKATLAGLTSLWGYALRDLLMVSRGDSVELDAIDDTQHDPATRRPSRKHFIDRLVARGLGRDAARDVVKDFADGLTADPTAEQLSAFTEDIDAGVYDTASVAA
ncbi:MAG: ERF family protein [Planctomycetota bacterium]